MIIKMIEELKIVMEMLSQMTSYAFVGFIVYLIYSIIQYSIIPIATIFAIKIIKDAYLHNLKVEPFEVTSLGGFYLADSDNKRLKEALDFYIKKSKYQQTAISELPKKIKGLVDD